MTFEDWLATAAADFPLLRQTNCRPTSPADDTYNCIAWAAEDTLRWWWPDSLDQDFWPPDVPRVGAIDAFVQLYSFLGYRQQSDSRLKPELRKVAVFADAQGVPTHAARQLADGWWASKLGRDIDIEHELTAVEGPLYGKVAVILAGPGTNRPDASDSS